ncbi:MAG: ATP-dependent nuclease [Thermoplasmataceae archaeon]
MDKVTLNELIIRNLGPIKDDKISLDDFTFLIGRNNAGKSHYLKAIELLLSSGTKKDQIAKMQNEKSRPIVIEGRFTGVEKFTGLVTASNHKNAIEGAIRDGILKVVLTLDPDSGAELGVLNVDGSVHNPAGFSGNLLKVLPDAISILATADTTQELADKSTTALGKLKKEVMDSFFQELAGKTKMAMQSLDEFLNSNDPDLRSKSVAEFEYNLKNEFMGEFSEIAPSIEFVMPDETVISKEMKIILDDGNKTEVEQKGHGLQRATLLALLKLIANKGQKYAGHPPPIFLVGEIESYLHPHAQREMARALIQMKERYQVVTTTHSPFVIMPEAIEGFRRVQKTVALGSKNIGVDKRTVDVNLIKRHLERRGNIEGLFADRIILIEGKHDENFYERIRSIFEVPFPHGKLTLFVRMDGVKQLRMARKFYKQMCFDDISAVCDLDYLFCKDLKYLFSEFGFDANISDELRKDIGWTQDKDPKLEYVIGRIKDLGKPKRFEEAIKLLRMERIFILEHGGPEAYFKNDYGLKTGWVNVNSESDLLEVDFLRELMKTLLVQGM